MPEFITGKWIKKDAVVIDVGIHYLKNENDEYKICGDVKADSSLINASILTAVPGGIGSVTSALIYANAVKSYHKINNKKLFKFNYE